MSAHFAHKPKTDCVVQGQETETEEHIRGKHLLFLWLKNQFPDANVELEVYIQATSQIADILVNHLHGDFAQQTWAFEFQHSSLSDGTWKERHRLYREAGIHDFWIMDAEVFLKYSIRVEHARKFRDPLKTVFNIAGLCYYLDIQTSILTVDCCFVSSVDRYRPPGMRNTVTWEYEYHSPIQHSVPLKDIEFVPLVTYNYVALSFPAIKEKVHERLLRQSHTFQREEEEKQGQIIKDRVNGIRSCCRGGHDDRFTRLVSSFITKNMLLVKEDLLAMEPVSFLEKYEHFVVKIDSFLAEYVDLRQSGDLQPKIIVELAPYYSDLYDLDPDYLVASWMELFDAEFLSAINGSFTDFLTNRYSENIMTVLYVLGTYDKELDKLMSYNPIVVAKRLGDISYILKPRGKFSKEELAARYMHCDSSDQADQLMSQIKKQVIEEIENPSWLNDFP